MLFHCDNVYANAPQCYVIRTVPALLNVQSEDHGDEAFPFWPYKLRNDRLSAGSFPFPARVRILTCLDRDDVWSTLKPLKINFARQIEKENRKWNRPQHVSRWRQRLWCIHCSGPQNRSVYWLLYFKLLPAPEIAYFVHFILKIPR
jgi:hypothetical protein